MKIWFTISIIFVTSLSYSQGYVKGFWEGSFRSDSLIDVKINILEQNSKRVFAILIIEQNLVGIYDSCFDGTTLHLKTDFKETQTRNEKMREFEINKAKKTKLYSDIVFSATLTNKRLVGKLKLDQKEFPLTLTSKDLKEPRPYELSRIFNPYYHEQVQCKNLKDNVVLSGTLTLPKKEGKFPVVIIQTGSLPIERISNDYIPAFFQTISDYLAKSGIATLYFDSRGSGKSTGNFLQSTPLDLSYDLILWHDLLVKRSDIISNKIGIIGHSEGAIVAAMAAGKSSTFNQIIFLGAPGIPIREVFKEQAKLRLEDGKISKDDYLLNKKINEIIYNLIDLGATEQTIVDSVMTYKESLINRYGDPIARTLITWIASPHNLFNLKCDPSGYLEKTTCPVFALYGSKDRQVEPKANQEAIRWALNNAKNTDFRIIELQGLNHNFQECNEGTIDEAQKIDPAVSTRALELMTQWILKHAQQP